MPYGYTVALFYVIPANYYSLDFLHNQPDYMYQDDRTSFYKTETVTFICAHVCGRKRRIFQSHLRLQYCFAKVCTCENYQLYSMSSLIMTKACIRFVSLQQIATQILSNSVQICLQIMGFSNHWTGIWNGGMGVSPNTNVSLWAP